MIMSMNQNQKLLVESKRNWIQRLFGLNEREVGWTNPDVLHVGLVVRKSVPCTGTLFTEEKEEI